MTSLLIILALIPVIVICTYIYMKDRNKEPWGLLIKLFLLGIASCFLVLILSEIVFTIFPFMQKDTSNMTFFEVMAYAFIGVALIEELCKWFMAYVGSYSHRAYNEVYDGIVYAVYVSLGFACFENLLYVLDTGSVTVGITRALLAVPGHACDAVFMGYYLSLAKVHAYQGRKDLEKKNLLLSIIVPTILHGIYDFCLFAGIDILLLVFFMFVIFMYIISIKKIKKLAGYSKNTKKEVENTYSNQNLQRVYTPEQNHNPNISQTNPPRNKFCPNCGSPVVGNFCPYCGTRQN